MRRTRRNRAPRFKAKVAIPAIKGDKVLAEHSEFRRTRFGVKWQLQESAADALRNG